MQNESDRNSARVSFTIKKEIRMEMDLIILLDVEARADFQVDPFRDR